MRRCAKCISVLIVTFLYQAPVVAEPGPVASAASPTDLPPNITKLIRYGQVLRSPMVRPQGTTRPVAYELGTCHQLDRDHCLLVASMDEQGGGDLCVGNDGFIIEKLSDIATAEAIPLNRSVREFAPDGGAEKAFLAKYPALGAFVPLGAVLANGKPHPAAGTGVLFSGTSIFRPDKTTQEDKPKQEVEVIQLRWDGSQLEIVHREIISKLLDLELTGSTPIASCTGRGVSLSVRNSPRRRNCLSLRLGWTAVEADSAKQSHGKIAQGNGIISASAGRHVLFANALPRP